MVELHLMKAECFAKHEHHFACSELSCDACWFNDEMSFCAVVSSLLCSEWK